MYNNKNLLISPQGDRKKGAVLGSKASHSRKKESGHRLFTAQNLEPGKTATANLPRRLDRDRKVVINLDSDPDLTKHRDGLHELRSFIRDGGLKNGHHTPSIMQPSYGK